MEAKIEQIRSEQGLSALQTRLEALHAAKLLSDDERDIIEDKIADSVEGGDGSSGDDTVSQMVALSSKMVVDRAFNFRGSCDGSGHGSGIVDAALQSTTTTR